jgi:hypothetical protein
MSVESHGTVAEAGHVVIPPAVRMHRREGPMAGCLWLCLLTHSG